jgi:acyl carrier protein
MDDRIGDSRESANPISPPGEEASTLVPNSLQQLVTEFWSEVLGIDEIDVDVNFFELGGNSLLAMQVVSRVRHTLGIEVPLIAFFDRPTVAGLAAATAEILLQANPDGSASSA